MERIITKHKEVSGELNLNHPLEEMPNESIQIEQQFHLLVLIWVFIEKTKYMWKILYTCGWHWLFFFLGFTYLSFCNQIYLLHLQRIIIILNQWMLMIWLGQPTKNSVASPNHLNRLCVNMTKQQLLYILHTFPLITPKMNIPK